MEWILILMMMGGGIAVTAIPSFSSESECLVAKHQFEATGSMLVGTRGICIKRTRDEHVTLPNYG